MYLAFKLSMPGCNSWDGRWSGENGEHVKVLNVKTTSSVKLGYYSYDFGDGWRAGVSVDVVDKNEAHKLKKRSNGFCGYDWMVQEIIKYGRIRPEPERRQDNKG